MRVTISLSDELAKALENRANNERRSVSNYTARLIEADLRNAGAIPASAELAAAADEVGGTAKAIAILQSTQRPARNRKRPAPALRRYKEAA